MKPRKKDDQGKGLARWRWIKFYLGPALKYAGITSDEFDKIISGGDQHVQQGQDSVNRETIPSIGISINGTSYAISGEIPPEDGYISIAFDYEPTVTEIDGSSSPASFIFSGTINLLTLPTWILGNELNARASVMPDGTVGSLGRAVIPVAFRSNQTMQVFIRSNINFQTIGTLGIDAYFT